MRPVLITAGATRNRIDAMRFISAHSSGRTGAHIAAALRPGGVLFMGSPEACLRAPEACEAVTYSDTLDLLKLMEAWVTAHPRGVVVHAAAVGDYMVDPADSAAQTKRPSGQASLDIRLVPTPKIIDQIATWSSEIFLISFKAAPPESDLSALEDLARAQQKRTRSHLVFANTIGHTHSDLLLLDGDTASPYQSRDDALHVLVQRIQAARLT